MAGTVTVGIRPYTPCWEWEGWRFRDGYGRLNRQGVLVHRAVWEAIWGPIPSGMQVLHRCDNKPCMRPDHLFLGTPADNMADKVAKGRQSKGPRHAAIMFRVSPYGTSNHNAKLNDDAVRFIRRSHPQMTKTALGKRYGVSIPAITSVLKRRTWKRVADGG